MTEFEILFVFICFRWLSFTLVRVADDNNSKKKSNKYGNWRVGKHFTAGLLYEERDMLLLFKLNAQPGIMTKNSKFYIVLMTRGALKYSAVFIGNNKKCLRLWNFKFSISIKNAIVDIEQ